MKIPLLFLLIGISHSIYSQIAWTNCNDPVPKGEVFSTVSLPPVFGNCTELRLWDHDNTFSYECTDLNVLNYLKDRLTSEIEGTIKISAIVERSGCLSGIKILEDNEENDGLTIKKLVARMPKWKPGMLDGKYVRTKVVILYQPLDFQ
ncbi:MAG: hypothetical protein CMP48_23160 [Rickettsiales bacterium]|nr:hypothetical protein [Rickettsiales bacterium]